MYIYKSPVGTFWIKPQGNRFILGIDDEKLGSYHSAVGAADDVFMHSTGCYEWDSLDGEVLDAPAGLNEWMKT